MPEFYHLNCGAIASVRIQGLPLVSHCLLIKTAHSGLVLVDTGRGEQDLINPVPRYGKFFSAIWGKASHLPALAAVNQIKQLGFDPSDVKHIIFTHLDLDHIGGLADFPQAQAHVYAAEYAAARKRKRIDEKIRYPEWFCQDNEDIIIYSETTDIWQGLPVIRLLPEEDKKIFLLPVPGHSPGHCAVITEKNDGAWLVHAGDAYFDHKEISEVPSCHLLLRVFQLLGAHENRSRHAGRALLRNLSANPEITIFCSHDPVEFSRLKTQG